MLTRIITSSCYNTKILFSNEKVAKKELVFNMFHLLNLNISVWLNLKLFIIAIDKNTLNFIILISTILQCKVLYKATQFI